MIELPKVSDAEVRQACEALGIRDWSGSIATSVTVDEARALLDAVGGEVLLVPIDDFREGLDVELEHGTRFPDANVTNNHPVLTGKIVLAHLKESLLYYKRLLVVELEGDLLKALRERDLEKAQLVQRRILGARQTLTEAEIAFLGGS